MLNSSKPINPIRILHVFTPNFRKRFGGPIFNWKYYFSHWNNQDVVHLVLDTERKKILDAKQAFDFEFDDNQILYTRPERFFWVFILIRSLIINKDKYDIIHFHLLWWAVLAAVYWAKNHNIPTVYETVLLGEDTPGGLLKQELGKTKVRLLKNFSKILAISEILASDYLDNGFLNDQVFMQMNCIDTDLFHGVQSDSQKIRLRTKLSLPRNDTIYLFVGSLIERKGFDVLIKAFITAAKHNTNFSLVVIGPKSRKENPTLDQAIISKLSIEIADNHLTERIKFIGLIQDRNKLSDYYHASDIFVFPSRNEGLPNVVLEAMAAAMPVIVTQLPGLKNVIEDSKNGFLIPIGDITALTQAIEHLGNNPDFSKKIGYAAHKYIIENHSFTKWQINIVNFYKGMIR